MLKTQQVFAIKTEHAYVWSALAKVGSVKYEELFFL